MIHQPQRHQHISFGWGVRLAEESWYTEVAFKGAITPRAFRGLCKALQVPMLIIGKKRFVDMIRFEIAMTAITRIGEPDFIAPGGKRSPSKLDLARFQANMKPVLAELLYAKKANGVRVKKEVEDATALAAEAMAKVAAGEMPRLLQEVRAGELMAK